MRQLQGVIVIPMVMVRRRLGIVTCHLLLAALCILLLQKLGLADSPQQLGNIRTFSVAKYFWRYLLKKLKFQCLRNPHLLTILPSQVYVMSAPLGDDASVVSEEVPCTSPSIPGDIII